MLLSLDSVARSYSLLRMRLRFSQLEWRVLAAINLTGLYAYPFTVCKRYQHTR